MTGVLKSLAAAAVLAGAAAAQPPGGGPPPKTDPQLEAWVKTLTDKMNDPHDAIRESARAAIVAVGPPAAQVLAKLAEGSDAKAFTAQRLLQQIARGGAVGGRDPNARDGGGREPGGREPAGRDPGGRDANPLPTLLGRLLGELKLTPQQQELVAKVVEGFGARMRENMDRVRGGELDRTTVRDAMLKANDEATAALRKVLTAEQNKRLDELAPPGRPLFLTPADAARPAPERGQPDRGEPRPTERPRPTPERP